MKNLRKNFLFLIIIIISGIICGILFANILSTEDEKLVYIKITDYFTNLKNNVPINYFENFLTSLKNNYLYLIVIWLLGLSIIGLVINNFLLFLKSFILGFSIGSIINIYLYSGIILSFWYIFPVQLLNLLIYFLIVHYANIFSFKLFQVLFMKKEYHFKELIKKYSKLLGITAIILFISSLLETFLTPFIIKLFGFLIK